MYVYGGHNKAEDLGDLQKLNLGAFVDSVRVRMSRQLVLECVSL